MGKIFETFIRKVVRIFFEAAEFIVIAMMILTTADVAGRYLANRPIKGALELSEFMLVTLVSLGLGYLTFTKGHVSINMFYDKLTLRKQAILDAIAAVISTLIFGLIARQAVEYSFELWHAVRVSDVLDIPISIFVFVLGLGTFFACLASILHLFQAVGKASRSGDS